MKRVKDILAHLGIAFALSLLVLIYVNDRNPMMGFFSSTVSSVYLVLLALLTLALAVFLWKPWENKDENETPRSTRKSGIHSKR